ncbi:MULTISPECIES: DUF6292 family protein [Amycolatopsis]|uniref:DUF6292 family protein n=1 Tax=Amycolatopsis TaxID=1813 RepID=UPI001F342A85|nr:MULTISPECIES: DUF6292 family protein [Amycolatopsis]UKD58705.1 DUF6292 family protein [Amycolatopsis sp. FU40]
MIATPHVPPGNPHAVLAPLRGYLAEVARALGVGPEFCALDPGPPVSAYVALDGHLPGCPGRDVALLWDEVHGWSTAVETHSGEDLIVLRYFGGATVVPPPAQLLRFVTALRAAITASGSSRRPSCVPSAVPPNSTLCCVCAM